MDYGLMIKNARKSVKLTQADISTNNISRNLISDIEKGKVRIVPSKALIIYKKILFLSVKDGKVVDLDFDAILNDQEEYCILKKAALIIEDLLKARNYNGIMSLHLLEKYRVFALSSPIGKFKYHILELISLVIADEEVDYRISVLINMLDCLMWEPFQEIQGIFQDNLKAFTQIAYRGKRFSLLIKYYSFLEENLIRSKVTIDSKIYYNLALFHKSKHHNDLSLKYIQRYFDFETDIEIDIMADLLIMRGNILVERGEIEEGLEEYKSVLKLISLEKCYIQESKALSNLIYNISKHKLNYKDDMIVYLTRLETLIPETKEKISFSHIRYTNMAIAYHYLGISEKSQYYIDQAFESSTKSSEKVDVVTELFNSIVEIKSSTEFNELVLSIIVSELKELERSKFKSFLLLYMVKLDDVSLSEKIETYVLREIGE